MAKVQALFEGHAEDVAFGECKDDQGNVLPKFLSEALQIVGAKVVHVHTDAERQRARRDGSASTTPSITFRRHGIERSSPVRKHANRP